MSTTARKYLAVGFIVFATVIPVVAFFAFRAGFRYGIDNPAAPVIAVVLPQLLAQSLLRRLKPEMTLTTGLALLPIALLSWRSVALVALVPGVLLILASYLTKSTLGETASPELLSVRTISTRQNPSRRYLPGVLSALVALPVLVILGQILTDGGGVTKPDVLLLAYWLPFTLPQFLIQLALRRYIPRLMRVSAVGLVVYGIWGAPLFGPFLFPSGLLLFLAAAVATRNRNEGERIGYQ